MDTDALHERFHQSRRDDRGPVTRFLDLLDYGRNEIQATVFPHLEEQARLAGNVGANGVGKVFGSDVLRHLGVSNKIISAAGGFVYDLATDPLTYIGPAGWGFKTANAAGRGVRIGLRGKQALSAGIKAIEAGAEIADPATRALIKSSGAATAAEASSRVLGGITSGKVGRAVSKVGGELERKGGILAEQFDEFGKVGQEAEQASAARQFVSEYGKGSAPGIRIGKNAAGKWAVTMGKATTDGPIATSTIAHIPFTEFGIHVPAFSADGRAAADAFRIANAAGRMEPLTAAGPTVQKVAGLVRSMQDVAEGRLMGDIPAMRQEIDNTIRAGAKPASPDNMGELLAIRRLSEEADASAKAATAQAEILADPYKVAAHQALAEANLRLADVAKGSVINFGNTADEPTRRIIRRLLDTDDDIMGASALSSYAQAARAEGDPGVMADISSRIDRGVKRTFGPPDGQLKSAYRYLQNTMSVGHREAFHSAEQSVRGDILTAMSDAGYSNITPDDYLKAANIAFAHMFAFRNAAEPGRDVFYATKFGTSDPADWVKLLEDSRKSGAFAPGVHGDSLAYALRGIAQKNVAALDEFGRVETSDDILGRLLEGYVPTSVTPEAKSRIRQTMEYPLRLQRGEKAGGVPDARGMAAEAFQKPRSTLQYRFEDPATGEWQRFFEKDRWVQSVSDGELEAIRKADPAAAAHVEGLRDTIKNYERLAENKGFAAKYAPKNTDPWELNELVHDGAFSLMLGLDEIPGGFADTNVATVMAARSAAHEKAVARRSWLDYAGSKGITAEAGMRGKYKKGGIITLPNGAEAKGYEDYKTGEWGVEIMGDRYRPLHSKIMGLKGNPIIEGIGEHTAKIYHEDVARLVEDSARIYEEQGPEFLRYMDQATAAWKAATLAHPSWTVGNIVGDSVNHLTGGARLQDFARHAVNVAKLFANPDDLDTLRSLTFPVRSGTMTGEQLVNDLRANRLIGTNQSAETALQLIRRKFFMMPSQIAGGEARTGIKGALESLSPTALKSDFLQRLTFEAAAGKGGLSGKAKAAGFVARDRFMSRVLAPWFRLNGKVNDYTRALAYLSHLEQGHDIPSAVQRTIRSGFDYSATSRVENTYLKRLWPWYSWMRLNGAYQMKLLMERPIYTGSFPLLQNAIEEAIAGNQRVPTAARPAWMQNQLAIMIGNEPNDRSAVVLGQTLPQEQALTVGAAFMGEQGVQDFLRYFVSGLNPVIRSPAEYATGHEFFSGRTVGPDADVSTGEFLTNQVRPLKEAEKVSQTIGEQGIGAAIGRGILGGRIQPATDERLAISRKREFDDEAQKLHHAINRAERKGNKAESVDLRARLLHLYQDQTTAGLGDSVPKWAKRELSQISPAPMAL